jgi:hypothetical protein
MGLVFILIELSVFIVAGNLIGVMHVFATDPELAAPNLTP